ncbi:hypothetical protein [Paenibacillus germinis]|nr:hypothetical protein [Paenibacillus germinis]
MAPLVYLWQVGNNGKKFAHEHPCYIRNMVVVQELKRLANAHLVVN